MARLKEKAMNTPRTGDGGPSAGAGARAPGEHPWGDRGQIVALVAFLAIWALDSFAIRRSTFLAGDVSLLIRLGASGLVLALAVYFMQGGHRAIPHDLRPSPGLITGGAFARVRHPLYAGSLFVYLALAIGTLSLVSLAVWCVIFIFYDVIASFEEKRLAEAYGSAYRTYQDRVPKWVPRLRPARVG